MQGEREGPCISSGAIDNVESRAPRTRIAQEHEVVLFEERVEGYELRTVTFRSDQVIHSCRYAPLINVDCFHFNQIVIGISAAH